MNIKRSESGQGGRRGHSDMSHWAKTADVKALANQLRRANDRAAVAEGRA
jgi:hypothetical protein